VRSTQALLGHGYDRRNMRYDLTVSVTGAGSGRANTPPGRVVMVIEDDATIRAVMTDVLEDRGYRVVTSSNGAEALQQLESVRPNVLVLDLLMPVMHGWEFMESYFDKTDGAAIPIVIVSVNPVLPRSFDRFGVRECVGKPFQVNDLIRAVEDAAQPVAA
jgi:two-component system chemotaxis response regulator CheY